MCVLVLVVDGSGGHPCEFLGSILSVFALLLALLFIVALATWDGAGSQNQWHFARSYVTPDGCLRTQVTTAVEHAIVSPFGAMLQVW